MGKLILYIAATEDLMIAKADGSIDFLEKYEQDDSEDYGYDALINSIEATIMGNSSFKKILTFPMEFPYKDKMNYVFTKTQKPPVADYMQYISNDPSEFVDKLKKQTTRDIWLIGGGEINSIMLNSGLIDKIILTIVPITLGSGIPLFAKKTDLSKFSINSTKNFLSGLRQLEINL